MSLMPMRDLLATARNDGYAVGYFEAWDQYSFEAVLEAAEIARSPVILGFGSLMLNQAWFRDIGLPGLSAMGRALAERAVVPVSYLLNEVATYAEIEEGLRCGFNAVMQDTSHLPFEDNIRVTRRVAEAAHALGADAEGESDALPDASGASGSSHDTPLTDPQTAARYVAETGVDALSIAIGNVHILSDGRASIDFPRLERIRAAVDVPLVVHGGTGFPEEAIPRAIELGVAKFNIGTILKQRYLEGMREALLALPDKPDIQSTVGSRKSGDPLLAGKARVRDEVLQRMALYGCCGKG